MRTELIAFLLVAGCNSGKVAELQQEVARLQTENGGLIADKLKLAASLKDAEQGLALDDIAAKACSEDEMAKQLRIHFEEHIGGYTQNMGFSADRDLDDRGHLKDPAAFAKRLRDYCVRHYGGQALSILVGMYGAEVGSAVFYGRVAER